MHDYKPDHQKEYLLITTGGTIDSEPYPDVKNPPKNAEALACSIATKHFRERMLARHLKEGMDFDILHWKAKDSKKFSRSQLQELANIIKSAPHKKILVVHGTDRMVRTSKRLSRAMKFAAPEDSDKNVAVTGAMIPAANDPTNVVTSSTLRDNLESLCNFDGYAESDGLKNMDDAIKYLDAEKTGQRLPVAIVFHGKPFNPYDTLKNYDTWQFQSSSSVSL